MALTVQQLIQLACQKSNTTGYIAQAGYEINIILSELAQNYSFTSAQGFFTGNFFSGIGGVARVAPVMAGSGPYQLPANFLRMKFGDFFYVNGAINYFPVPRDMVEFDQLQQQSATGSLPTDYAIDMSVSPPALYLWPAPSGVMPFYGRYDAQQADLETPEISLAVPWFPSQSYLLQRLSAQMMGYSGDKRMAQWMGDAAGNPPWSATGLLKAYMEKEGNQDTRAVRAKLDPRSFGPGWSTLAPTKSIPWPS